MTRRKQHEQDRAESLERAQNVAGSLDRQENRVDNQVSFASRLTAGWRRVHEKNHLAQLFDREYGETR